MKLSDLGTDETLNVLCEITPHIECIVKDEKILNVLAPAASTKGMTSIGILMTLADRAVSVMPFLLKDHRVDLYAILSSVNRKTVEEIASQKLTETLAQMDDMLHDEALMAFFGSFRRRGRKAFSAPSAPPPASAQADTLHPSQPS